MMRILVLSNLFPPHFLGGYELLCQQVCDLLAQRGHELAVLTSDHDNESKADESGKRPYPIHRALQVAVPFAAPARFYPWAHRAVLRHNHHVTRDFLDSFQPDIVFLWSQLRLTVGPLRAVMESGVPNAWTFNDANILSYLPRRRGMRGVMRFFLSNFVYPNTTLKGISIPHSTAISQQLNDDLLIGGLPILNCQVIHQGIPIDSYPLKADAGRIGSPLRVLYTGQLHSYKGVHTLIDAIATYADRRGKDSIIGTIVGDGDASYRLRLESQARKMNLSIKFCGRIPREHLVTLYHENDVFVFPSIWREPFGLTHLEAMACGTPVISTANGGQGEFLCDGENSLVFKEDNAEELSACLEKLADSPDLAREIAHEGRITVETRFTLARYVDRLEGLLEMARSHHR
jgi:glycogen synthase